MVAIAMYILSHARGSWKGSRLCIVSKFRRKLMNARKRTTKRRKIHHRPLAERRTRSQLHTAQTQKFYTFNLEYHTNLNYTRIKLNDCIWKWKNGDWRQFYLLQIMKCPIHKTNNFPFRYFLFFLSVWGSMWFAWWMRQYHTSTREKYYGEKRVRTKGKFICNCRRRRRHEEEPSKVGGCCLSFIRICAVPCIRARAYVCMCASIYVVALTGWMYVFASI